MSGEHTVSSFDQELRHLHATAVRMGGLAAGQVYRATEALLEGNLDLAREVAAQDAAVDALRDEIRATEQVILARRQPLAQDLREVVACGRVATDLERIGDHAKNIARRRLALAHERLPGKALSGIRELHRAVAPALGDVVRALEDRDAELARQVWLRDKDLDHVFNELFARMLELMQSDARVIPACTHLLFVARSLERCGDHATNVAEDVVYWVTGALTTDVRPQESGLPDIG